MNVRRHPIGSCCLVVMILLGLSSVAHAQRREAIDPPGFTRISIGGKEISCAPEDVAWIRRAMASYKRPQSPTTMPTELITRVADQRAALTKQMIEDLALPNEKFVAPIFDQNMLPQLQRLTTFKTPFVYLVTSRAKVKAALIAGWSDPRYVYNRALEDFTYDDNVQLTIDRPMDDAMLFIAVEPEESVEDKSKHLIDGISGDDESIDKMVWGRGNQIAQAAFTSLIADQVITPLKLSEQQRWFGHGLVGCLSAKYTAQLIGLPYDDVIARMTGDAPQALITAAQIDLLNPVPPNSLQPEYRGLYEDALRRKSTIVVNKLISQAGEGTVAKLLLSLRKKVPNDGPSLVKEIKDATGVDLQADLAPQQN